MGARALSQRDARWATAYHEAGHCVVGLLTGAEPTKSSIVAGDNLEGATWFDDDPRALLVEDPPREASEWYIIRALAGPMAERAGPLALAPRERPPGGVRPAIGGQMLTPVVRLLLLLNGVVFLAELVDAGPLIGWFALWPAGLLAPSEAAEGAPQFWPLQVITYAFLHGGLLH